MSGQLMAVGDDRARESGRFFDGRAERYDGEYDAQGPDGHALRARMDTTLRRLGPGPGSLLDVGMGPGRLCAECAGRGWTVAGVDASQEMVERARARLPGAAGRLVHGSVEQLPFPESAFDAVTGTGVFEYVGDLPAALREVHRVLRPGGLAVLSIPNPSAPYAVWLRVVIDPLLRLTCRLGWRDAARWPRKAPLCDPDEFARRLESAGLDVQTIEYTSLLVIPRPVDRLLPRLATRLGSLAGRGGVRAARLLGTQAVVSATRPPSA